MKYYILIILILLFNNLWSIDFEIDDPIEKKNPNKIKFQVGVPQTPTYIGSVPTPETLSRGKFLGSITIYDKGGINGRLLVGIFEILDIGISENFDQLIGSGQVFVNIPSAYIKITFLKDNPIFGLAIGFDNFILGIDDDFIYGQELFSSTYGFWITSGWKYSIFGQNDITCFGIRIPLLPDRKRDITNTSVFLGTSVGLSKYLSLGLTVENIYFNILRFNKILPSLIINFVPSEWFIISLILQYNYDKNSINRIISLAYNNSF